MEILRLRDVNQFVEVHEASKWQIWGPILDKFNVKALTLSTKS